MRVIIIIARFLLVVVVATTMLSGCAVMTTKAKPPIIITGPMGIQTDRDSYRLIRIKNASQAYWRFWLGANRQEFILFPGRVLFVKMPNNFWGKCQGFWSHAYMEVNNNGTVDISTFAGEQWSQVCITGNKWICETGEVIGGDIVFGGIPQSNYHYPTHFSVSVPFVPVGLHLQTR